MKNKRLERNKLLARQYHRNQRGSNFDLGIVVSHIYGPEDLQKLSWWDDVDFILGGMRVSVAWCHPRQAYKDLISAAVRDATEDLYAKIEGGLFADGGPDFKKLGRSRKKVISYTTPEDNSPEAVAWFDARRQAETRLSGEADFSVEPSIVVSQLCWCRFVEIVVPIEVRSVEELRDLATLVRRILKRETTLDQEFPGYVYGKAHWHAEGLAEAMPSVVSHRVAGM